MTIENLLGFTENTKRKTVIKCNNQEEWTKCCNATGNSCAGANYFYIYPYISLSSDGGRYSEDYIKNNCSTWNIYNASDLFNSREYSIKTSLLC